MQGFLEPKQGSSVSASASGEGPGDSVLLPAISRLGFPVMLFGGVFLVLTMVLIQMTSPDRFPVRIADKVIRLSELEAQDQSLEKEEAAIAREREKLKIESSAKTLYEVRRLKQNMFPVGRALLAIDTARRGFATDLADPISLPTVEVSGSGGVITIGGEVRDKNGRSMQLLASFVDSLRGIRMFEHVSEPEYGETGSPDGASISPFTLTITLSRG